MLIAARESFAVASRRRGWTNPYITDGLVAMWDGEWNAGGGVHDPNATDWKDLVGSNHFGSFASGVTFGDKYISLPAKKPAAKNAGLSSSSIYTVEAVVSLSAWNGLVLAVFSNNSTTSVARWLGFRSNKTFNFQNNGLCAQFSAAANTAFHCAGAIRSNSWTLHYNGTRMANDGIGMNWGGSLNGIPSLMTGGTTVSASKIYVIRLYSRGLANAEIAANYAIDRERFNLP